MSTYNNLPDYEALFGEMDFKEGDEARSVFSPAAYLSDLLQMMDDEFTSTEDVESRRSDIRQIILDYENTFEEIPYLEIVNEVLENKIGGEVYDDVLLNASYPFNAPFSLNHAEIQLYLKHLGISSEELYKTFSLERDDTIIAREYLNLSEEEYELVIKDKDSYANDNTYYAAIEAYYGYSGESFATDMANVTTFLETTDLSGVETREFLFQNLREEEYGEQTNFFINYQLDESEGYASLDDDEENIIWSNDSYETMPYEWFDRVNRFVRLSKKIGIGFTDLDLILRHCCSTELDADAIEIVAVVKKIKEDFDLAYDVIVALLSTMNEVGHTEEDEPADLFNKVYNNRCAQFDERYILGSVDIAEQFVEEEYTEIEYFDDLFSDDNYDFRKRVRYVLGLSKTDLEKIIQRLDDKEISDDLWMLAENKVGLLNFLYRFTKLSEALDISHEELFTLFDTLEYDPTIASHNQLNIFLSYLPSTQDCYAIFMGTDIKDLQWLIQTLYTLNKWMQAHDFNADALWAVTTGKYKTEEAEEAADKMKTAVLNELYQGFKPLALKPDSFIKDPFDVRASAVIYRTAKMINENNGGKYDIRLVSYNQETLEQIAHKAVVQLGWIHKEDFMGIGLGEKLSEKIFKNLVIMGYTNEQGVIQPNKIPENKEAFRIETDYSAYDADLFDLLHELYNDEAINEEDPEDINVMVYPSDLRELGLKENEIDEIYDNLIFNNYLDEEGNMQYPTFFANPAHDEAFDINSEINNHADDIYMLFQKHLRMFDQGKLVISKGIFGDLELSEVETNDLIENLIFNEYIDEKYIVQDKKRILDEDAGSFALALQFYPRRHEILKALKDAVGDYQKNHMTVDRKVLDLTADRIASEWAYQELQEDYLNGPVLLPEVKGFFMDPENKKNFTLSYYFDKLPGTVIFDRIANIIKSIESFRINPKAFADLKFSEEETEGVFEILLEMEAIMPGNKLPMSLLDYYLDSNNALTFSVEYYEDYSKEIFFILQAVAKRVVNAEKIIKDVLAETAKKQDDFIFSQLQSAFGVNADTMRSITKEVFPGEYDLKTAWMLPTLHAVDVLDNVSEEPGDPSFNTIFNRVKQFAVMATKLQLTKEEVEIAFRDQNLVAKYPEKLELPDDIETFDAILEGEDFIYLFYDSKYWIYRKSDYELVDKTDLEDDEDLIDLQRDDDELRDILEEDPVRLLFEKEESINVTAAFKDKEENTYIFAEDHYFVLPKDSDTWNKMDFEFGYVDNEFETLTEIDSAYKDEEGALFLFSDGKYIRYSDGYDYVDEGYPKTIADDWKHENLKIQLPEKFHLEPNAAFEGTDGNTYFFHNQGFVSSEHNNKLMRIADYWGKPEYSFKNIRKIDAAFTDGGGTYFFAGEIMVKYTDCIENAGIKVAEGFPMKIMDFYPALPHEFSKGVDAAFRGEDGKIHLFKDDQSVSFTEEDTEISLMDLADTWGIVQNNIQTNGTIDATMVALDGKTYVFSGDQYFCYSGNNYAKADSGYPRLTSEDFEGLMQVEAAFVLDGKTYLFGIDDSEERVYIRYSTVDYTEVDEEDEDEATYVTAVESLPDVEEVETFPREQDDEWWSLPDSLIDAGFTNVDAVFNGHDGKTYLFAGEYVVAFEEASRWWSEPEKISEKWDNLTFTSVDAALAGKDGRTYLFSGTEYVRISDPDFCKIDNGYPRTISKYWGEIDNNIEKYHKIDATVVLESREDDEDENGDDIVEINTHTYLFSGNQFFRYVGDDYSQVEHGYPKKMNELKDEPRFKELKAALKDGVDAAIADNRNVYLFKGLECHIISEPDENYYYEYDSDDFKGISTAVLAYGSVYTLEDSTWKRLSNLEGVDVEKVEETPNFLNSAPDSFKTSLDAVLRGTDGNTYLFKGTECYNTLMELTYDTGDEWGRARNNIYINETIDAAFVGRDGKTYVFSGDQYFVYETDTYIGQTTEDPPEIIAEKWGGLNSVMLAYVKDDLTYLFEKPDSNGHFRYVVYSDDAYKRPNAGYPKRTNIGFFNIPGKQMQEGFDRFDTILMHGDNMIFIKDQDFIRYNTLEENWSYPKPLDLIYNDIPFNKTTFQDIKTAFVGADDTIYFFNEDCYITYQDGVFSEVMEIKDDWGLVNNNFEDSVDAAFVHNDQVTYLFSGNKYVRYSTSDYRYVDNGYPKEVGKDLRTEEPFMYMNKEFQYAIDEIEESGGDVRISGVVSNKRSTYVFINDKLYVGSKMKFDTLQMADIGKVRNNFEDDGVIDAAFVDSEGKTYLFSGDQYVRYSDDHYKYIDEGYPKLIVDELAEELGLDSVPADYQYGIDAAFTDEDGIVYLFRDNHYITSDAGTEQEVTENWGKIKNRFLEDEEDNTIDAAYIDEEGRLFVFKGDQFIRYTDPKELFTEDDELLKYVDEGYPMLIEDHDALLPADFREDLESTFMFEGRLYFVKGTAYVMAIDGYHTCDNNIYPQEFKYRWGEWADYLINDIYVLARFKKLQDSFSSDKYTLTNLVHGGTGRTKEPYLAVSEIFGFDKEEVRWVKGKNAFLITTNQFEKEFDMETIIKLYDILNKAQEMNVDASKLYEDVWANIYGNSPDMATAADAIYEMLGTIECNDNYQALLDQIEGELNTLKRDALVPYVIANDSDVEDARDLYEKLLIDVQMESGATTSRIKEATAAIQLFFHRYFINLEEVDLQGSNDEDVKETLKDQWEWMRNYRVWEANRKVFLYPENYIRPELRDTKTPPFETMEQDLLQGEITETAAERVYKKYLDEFTEVSRLRIAGGYVYDEPGSSGTDKNLVLFGRTKTDPLRYYYRFGYFTNGESDGATWDPWEKVEVAIESEKVYPVYAFYRVFVFWATTESFVEEEEVESAEVTVTDEDEDTQKASSENNTKYRVNIYFSFYNLNEEWAQPQLLDTTIEETSVISGVELFVENSEKLNDYDYDNIVVSCTYTVNNQDTLVAYRLTPELYTYTESEMPSYENKGKTIFNLLFNEGDSAITDDDIVMLNTLENNLDGPWFTYEYKGGGFLVKPDVAALSSDAWPQSLPGNEETLPKNEDSITAAFYDGSNTYYFVGTQYFTYNEEDAEYTKNDNNSRWGMVENNIQSTGIVNAAYVDNGITYLFSGDQYYIYSTSDYVEVDDGHPQPLSGNGLDFPEWNQIDAVFKGNDGNVYFFNNTTGKYIKKGEDTEYDISGKWGLSVNNFTDPDKSVQVMASFVYDGKIYMFNEDQYIRYSSSDFTKVDDGYPKTGYVEDFLSDMGFSDGEVPDVISGKYVESAHVEGNYLYIYTDIIRLKCNLNNKNINVNADFSEPETAFTFDNIVVIRDEDENKLKVYKDNDYLDSFYFKKNGSNISIDSAFTWNDTTVYLFYGQEYMVMNKSDFNIDDDEDDDDINIANVTWSTTGQIADTFGQEGTSDFDNTKIDAAYSNGNYTYLFSGDTYVRYTGNSYDYADSGYPKTIADNEDEIFPDGWASIDAVLQGADDITYFFDNDNKNYTSSDDLGDLDNTTDKWGILKANNFTDTGEIHAAFVRGDEIFLFSGTQFIKHTISGGEISKYIDPYYPKTIDQSITEVSAAFMLNNIVYLIADTMYYKLLSDEEPNAMSTAGAYIKGNWGNFPGDLREGMGAALVRDNQLFFIKGSEFIAYLTDQDDEPVPYEIEDVDYEVIRLTSSTADSLNQALLAADGIDGLLSAKTQQIDEIPSFSTTESTPTSILVTDKVPNPPVNTHLDFNSANGIYYWEVFFHAPFHIAMSLNADQKFEYAKEWYEYIYDPTQVTNYWKFLPFIAVDIAALLSSMEGSLENFQEDESKTVSEEFTTYADFADELDDFTNAFLGYTSLTTDELANLSAIETWDSYIAFADEIDALVTTNESDSDRQTLLENAKTNLEEILAICTKLSYRYDLMTNTTAQLEAYLQDPFDPHAIADLRKIAYRKAIVMNYIDNLLDWGDMLFRQYTRESINEARMLYVLAYDLLGRKPENLGEKILSDDLSYEELVDYDESTDPDYDVLIYELENIELLDETYDLSFSGVVHDSISNPYFFIPENSLFLEYWDRVEDRLYKIRNSLNIMGEKQPLALFQPPIDPMALVNAVAGGGSLSAALSDLYIEVPNYRFGYMISKAKEFAQKVEQFGGDLLAAIEKKDAEELNILYNKNEAMLLNLTTQVKEKQIEDAEENIKNLKASLDTAKMQRDHYKNLISNGLISEEETQIDMMIAAASIHGIVVLSKIVSGLSYVFPQITAGPFSFGVTAGGQQAGKMLEKFAESTESLSEGLSLGGEVAGIYAQHKRSVEDWDLQQKMAEGEIKQLKIQIKSAKIQKAIAEKELQIHEKDIENNKSVATFMIEKFSNKELYQWMSGKLSSMFYQSYKMAHDLAKQAEKAFQFETGTKEADINYIGGMYWDSQKKGLLSGESLGVDLARMEKAFMEQDVRTMEVTKNISLLELDPMAFIQLKIKGYCEFRFTEALFDHDFPGHFKRQIKSISLSFDIGDDQYVNATLTQLNNKVLLEPDVKAVKYLLDPKGLQPGLIRNDWRPRQQIALSYVDQYAENNGLFDLRYIDDQYLPFEGTGAIALWRLELNGTKGITYNPDDLLDVTIKLRYSANHGGTTFGNAVKGLLKPYKTSRFFDLAYSFSQEWNEFMQNDSKDLTLTFRRDMFPNMSGSKLAGLFLRYEYKGDGKTTFLLNDELKLSDSKYLESGNLSIAKEGSEWKFTVQGDKTNINNVEMITVYKAKAQ